MPFWRAAFATFSEGSTPKIGIPPKSMISLRSSVPQERQWLDRRTDGGKSMLNLLLAKLEGVAARMERFIPGYAFDDRFTGRHPGPPSQNADRFAGVQLQEL